jgi:exopolysaccharide biosynthesis polyprenyl glycosylphosphotransferase
VTLLEYPIEAPPGVTSVAPARPLVAPHFGTRDSTIRRVLALSDLVAVTLGLAGVSTVASGIGPWSLFLLPAWLLLGKAYGLYDRNLRRIGKSPLSEVPAILNATLLMSALVWLFAQLTPLENLGSTSAIVFASTTASAIALLRAIVRRMIPRFLGPERIAFIGDGAPTAMAVRRFQLSGRLPVDLVGVVASSPARTDASGLPILASLEDVDIVGVCQTHRVDRVVVSQSDVGQADLWLLIHRCGEAGVKVSVLPDLFDVMGSGVEVEGVQGIMLLGLQPPVLCRSSRILKRTVDLVGAVFLLVVTAPLALIAAVVVKLDGGGPVLFLQERVGKGGRRFRLAKFRTMVPGAAAMTDELLSQSRDGSWLLLDHDPRVTGPGRLLRRASLDELPQLWNVLKGDMSLVGPRPLIASEANRVDVRGRSRLDLMPGLTGPWQVLGRTSIPFEEMIKLDYQYVTNWSLWEDLKLLIETLPAVISGRGAN